MTRFFHPQSELQSDDLGVEPDPEIAEIPFFLAKFVFSILLFKKQLIYFCTKIYGNVIRHDSLSRVTVVVSHHFWVQFLPFLDLLLKLTFHKSYKFVCDSLKVFTFEAFSCFFSNFTYQR